ncbi:hypothetical protein [Mycobacterium sp. GA-1199]|uniref:hypothetical protein n=1 Tax=Mycobacterium sp. GA-1199 TaxID=1772287 RepID=UPI0018D2729B|nr:hypothetical protein [Mycobacterium sp. GA-1199]
MRKTSSAALIGALMVVSYATVDLAAAEPTTTPPAPRTVAEARADGSTPWLDRLHKAGLDHLVLEDVNKTAFEICDLVWVGGDYDRIIEHLAWDYSRKDAIQLYGVAVGHHCRTPVGAVPGFPK